ncbi:MAG: hypothetical protein KAX19_12755 [Candidatus Brocadiae bacterium]|nr:hypothetical protein [Candidatus Brocadiia bacterium]
MEYAEGSIGRVFALRLRARADPRRHGETEAPKTRGSSAARVLRLGQEWQRQLDAGEVESRAAIARREGLTRARVSQMMPVPRLAPELQRRVVSPNQWECKMPERALRPIAYITIMREQAAAFQEMLVEDSHGSH